MHLQPAFGRLEREPQASRRGFGRGLRRTEQGEEGAARFGGDRQASQMLITGRGEPGEQRVAAAGAQCLLRRPERVAPAGGAYQREVRQIDAGGGERRCIRQMRRREPDHPLPGAGEPRQGRHEQPQLADASGGHE